MYTSLPLMHNVDMLPDHWCWELDGILPHALPF